MAGVFGVLVLTSCSGGTHKAVTSPTPGPLIAISDACDGVLGTESTASKQLLGAPQVAAGPARYQVSLDQMAKLLKADTPLNAAAAKARSLCAVQPKNSKAWLSITFQWQPFGGVPPRSESTTYSTEFKGIGYAASSRDDNVLIDFSCRIPNAGENDGHSLYINARADTGGLSALPLKQKREAQLRVLHAASVSVATALHCSTNLPTKLGALKPLPLDK
jgi:hypothetical protein